MDLAEKQVVVVNSSTYADIGKTCPSPIPLDFI